MKVEKIDHIAILVSDIEKAGKFFGDLFETEFNGPNEIKGQDAVNMMSPIGIELLAPLRPGEGPLAKALERRGEGLSLLSLKVPDVAEADADMQARGIRRITGGNFHIYHPKDTFGVQIELAGGGASGVEFVPVQKK